MNELMQYMVIIKPDGQVHVVVKDRGEVPCERAEDIAYALGEVEETEILPDTTSEDKHLDIGDDE